MIYKICLVKNRTNEQANLQKFLDWFQNNTPINVELEVNVIETDFDVTSKFIGNATFKGVVCGDDIVDKLRTVIPENKYNSVVLYVGNPLNGIRVSTVNGGYDAPLYADTELIQLRTISDGGKDLNHELFHAFFMKLRKCQIDLKDPMDTYLNDSDLVIDSVVNTNRELALQLLRPYWDKICAFRSLSTNPGPIVNPLSTWKYFKPTEFTNAQKTHTISELKPEFVDLLDKMRGECGFVWKITSGYRTVSENALIENSASNSAHTTREAVDVYCIDDTKRDKILEVLEKNSIRRKGIAKTFIHIDISKTLPQDVTWLY
jgi:hypothetical protein